jgi:hypothetical protein
VVLGDVLDICTFGDLVSGVGQNPNSTLMTRILRIYAD